MAPVIKLTGARIARGAVRTERVDLRLAGSRILPFDFKAAPVAEMDLTGHLILPGLINSHDHLEFNLFPRLGRGPYPNASAWATDIYHPARSPIREHLLIPKTDRMIWGGIKNLLSGVTTVAHHNPWEPSIFSERFPVRVVRRMGWAHSLAFSPDLQDRWSATPAHWPFVIHAAEGTDRGAQAEIPRLEEMGILDHRAVLIHAVGTTPATLGLIVERGASIVCCPSANLFTLGCTVSRELIRSGVPIALGTDSALTGDGDFIDEMKYVKDATGLAPDEVYEMVTTNATRMLGLEAGQGTIVELGVADLVAVRDNGATPAQALMDLRPELVMVRGQVMLVSDALAARDSFPGLRGLHRIRVEGRGSWLIRADMPRLQAAASKILGPELRLAGKRICI